jgi:hypothetical protein
MLLLANNTNIIQVHIICMCRPYKPVQSGSSVLVSEPAATSSHLTLPLLAAAANARPQLK